MRAYLAIMVHITFLPIDDILIHGPMIFLGNDNKGRYIFPY